MTGLTGARAALERGDLRAALPAYAALMREARGEQAATVYNDVAVLAWRSGERARSDSLFERAANLAGARELAVEADGERRYRRLRARLRRRGLDQRPATARQVREGVIRRHFEDWVGTVEAAVVIPTRDRAPVLAECLRRLARTHLPAGSVEVVVVDDGSSDDTAGVVAAAELDRLTYVRMDAPRGPAAARNAGLRRVTAPVALFINDDTFVTPDLVPEHLITHLAAASPHVAVLGRVDWDPAVGVSPLMRMLDSDGMCFAFDDIDDPDAAGWERGYTCNLSFNTEWLRRHGGFDEDFPHAAGEDIELCYRLTRDHGLRIAYNPHAYGLHHHAVTLEAFAKRQHRVGAACALIARKHPELRDKMLHSLRLEEAVAADRATFAARLAALIAYYERALEARETARIRVGGAPVADAVRADLLALYRFYLHHHLNQGLLEGGSSS